MRFRHRKVADTQTDGTGDGGSRTRPEVIEWFKAQGENYQRDLVAALRSYAQVH